MSLHSWEVSPREAVALQRELRGRVRVDLPVSSCELIAGVDISYNRYSPRIYAGIVVLKFPGLEIVDEASAVMDVRFPYVPGLLSFREMPPALAAMEKLKLRPNLIFLDGQGLAHPRRFGLACHLGLWLDQPTLGCAKSRLVGEHSPVEAAAESAADLTHEGEVVGRAVRSKARTKPLYVSPGHRIDLECSVRWVLACCRGYRLPEPTRQAHLLVNRLRLADRGRSV